MSDDLVARLCLIRTPGVGPVAFRQLLARFGTAQSALDALPDLARRGKGRTLSPWTRGQAQREMDEVKRLGGRYLSLGQGLYPRALAEMEDAPPLLTVRGDLSLLDRPMVAMVGARNASAAACRFARGLARDLGDERIVVVSGLARGIDSAAHDGALESGTIGVIAGGLDVVYPPENADRQEAVASRGLLVAEMPPGTEPRARHFPYRNRIIAGLATGTVVVEAAPRSGSLITARLAAESGREVMAVPGSPLDPRAQGCNLLIREGATLVQNAADVIESIRPSAPRLAAPPATAYEFGGPVDAPENVRGAVEALLGPTAVPVDEVVRLSNAATGEVQLVLLELELAGPNDTPAARSACALPELIDRRQRWWTH